MPTPAGAPDNRSGNGDQIGAGDLLGMSIAEAAKKLLAAKRTTLRNPEIATLFKSGGLFLNSKDWTNTIGAVLTRRSVEVGDIVKIDRGTWGLKEWYPNRSFKTKPNNGDSKPSSTAPERLDEPALDVDEL